MGQVLFPHSFLAPNQAINKIMFESICSLPLSSELFAQAIHPLEPVLAVGLASGQVQCFKLPVSDDDLSSGGLASSKSRHGGTIDLQWRTKRHQISCRALAFSHDGDTLYSAGADGLLKAASTETGQVSSKVAIPLPSASSSHTGYDSATLVEVLSPQTLLIGTDSSALHVYDLRANSHALSHTKSSSTFFPHEDYVSSITPLPPSKASTSGFPKQWISTGGTTLAVTDLRKGVIKRSAEQDDELTCSLFISGFGKKNTSVGQKVVVGNSSGVLSLFENGVWDDLDERIVLDRGMTDAQAESVECLAIVPRDIAAGGKMLVAGMGAGLVGCVQLGVNKVVDVLRHDEVEGVVAVGFDSSNRMISGGGRIVKVWQERINDESENSDDIHDDHMAVGNDDDDDAADVSSSEEEQVRQPKKKHKTSNGTRQLGSFIGLD